MKAQEHNLDLDLEPVGGHTAKLRKTRLERHQQRVAERQSTTLEVCIWVNIMLCITTVITSLCRLNITDSINPLTAGSSYTRVFIFYEHIFISTLPPFEHVKDKM